MTRDATARLFVALDLPQEVRRRLIDWARRCSTSLRVADPPAEARETGSPGGRPRSTFTRSTRRTDRNRLRLLEPEMLHVTLCFLGNQPVGAIEAIEQAVTGAWREPVGELSLGAPLWLPKRRPRALAVELHDDAQCGLQALRDAVARELAAVCSFELPARRMLPHVTVARMRATEAPHERVLPPTPPLAFEPEAVTLYRSWLGPTEASYEALASCSPAYPAVDWPPAARRRDRS